MLLQGCDVPVLAKPQGEAGPVYVLRRPGHLDRARFEQAIADLGGESPGAVQLIDALDVAARRQLAAEPERLAEARAEIARHRSALQDWAAALEPARREGRPVPDLPEPGVALIDLQDDMRRCDARYRRKIEAPAFWSYWRGIAAATLFLVRIDGPEPLGPFGAEGPGAALDRIPSADLHAIGRAIEDASVPTERAMGNSGSASGGDVDQTPSE